MTLPLDSASLAEARRFNRKLDWAPRFKISNRLMPLAIQSLLRLSQLAGHGQLTRAGIQVQQRRVRVDGCSNAVPVRILRGARPVRGVVLDIHGGGWAIGNAQMNDTLNAALIAACDVAIVSVDYRFATSATIVYYGVYDLAGTPSVRAAGADTLVLHGPTMRDSLRLLTPGLSDAQRRQAPLSPLYGDLSGLPPVIMFAGQLDPLRDDTILLAERWRAVAEVECHVLPEAPHGFIRFPTSMARMVQARVHAWINARLMASSGCVAPPR